MIDKKIEFKCGYHEWALWIDNEFCFSDSGFVEHAESHKEIDKEYCGEWDFKNVTKNYVQFGIVDYIKEIVKDDFFDCPFDLSEYAKAILQNLTENDYNKIQQVVENAYYNYYKSMFE